MQCSRIELSTMKISEMVEVVATRSAAVESANELHLEPTDGSGVAFKERARRTQDSIGRDHMWSLFTTKEDRQI